MSGIHLQEVADLVVCLAQQQGYVVERDVREHLLRAGLSDSLWKDVLALVRPPLSYRRGRYYHSSPPSPHVLPEIHAAVSRLINQHEHGADRVERREQGRIDFIQPVEVTTEDNRTFTLLTRDLSATGIRLIGTRRLLGQKVRVRIPAGSDTIDFSVRILWTCPVGDDLVENGGTFLGVVSG
jgi:hypothetical protein